MGRAGAPAGRTRAALRGDAMKPAVRDRLVMPILLPLGILIVIAAALYGFSRILLSLTATAATATAIVVAAGVMAAATMASSRKQVRLSTLGAMLGVTAGVAMLAGGIALAVVGVGGEEEPEGPERPVVQLAAANIAFDPTSLTVPADTPFTIAFNNQDSGVQHNVDIFDNQDFSGTALFEGDLITGVATANYQVDALEAGTYFFRCVVHPAMTGEIQAEEGAGETGGPGGGGPAGGVTVIAQNIAFDTSTIELPSGRPSTITFDNRDAGVQHNIAIYTSIALEDELFNGELVTGPATVVYQVPALDAGEFFFHCVVHPNMSGNVIVSGGAEGEAGATGGT